jgi:hypothetical protein
MNSAFQHPPAVPHWVIVSSGAMSLLGCAGLVLTVVLGFETPNTALLFTSLPLSFALPLAVLWHFAATDTLTTAEKRMWIRDFTSAGAASAMSEYLKSPDLSASARRRAEDAAVRRTVTNHI